MNNPETYASEYILLNYSKEPAETVIKLMDVYIKGFVKGEEIKRRRSSNKNIYQLIIDTVFEFYDLKPSAGKKKIRKREIVQARQISYYQGSRLTNLSYQSMADQFKQDHATVIYGIKVIKNMILFNPVIKREITLIENRITEKLK